MSGELCISHEPSETWHWLGLIDRLPEEHYYFDSRDDWAKITTICPNSVMRTVCSHWGTDAERPLL